MGLRDFIFQSPRMAFLLLFALLIVWCFWTLYHYRYKILSSFSSLYTQMVIPRSSTRYMSKVTFITLSWILAAIALMQPAGNARYPKGTQNIASSSEGTLTNQKSMEEVIFLIDASASMTVKDARSGKSRLDSAKEIAEEIINDLSGQNVSVYAFTSQAESMVPPTLDYLFSRLVIRSIVVNDPGIAGTSLVNALKALGKNLSENPTATFKNVIILSDGGDSALQGMSPVNRQKALTVVMDQLKKVPGGEIRLFPIGLGTKSGGQIPNFVYQGKTVNSALDEEVLKTLSSGMHGQYYSANNYNAYSLAKDLVLNLNESANDENETTQNISTKIASLKSIPLIYDLYFQIPLGLALAFLSLYLWLPDVRKGEAIEK